MEASIGRGAKGRDPAFCPTPKGELLFHSRGSCLAGGSFRAAGRRYLRGAGAKIDFFDFGPRPPLLNHISFYPIMVIYGEAW